jgi:hypothetical protein
LAATLKKQQINKKIINKKKLPIGFAHAETREWSQQLRSDVETLVRSAFTDLTNYWKRTNASLRDHVSL